VVKPAMVRTVLTLALSRQWPVHQLDVKNAFLHGTLSEIVYSVQPFGFEDPAHPDFVCQLNKSLRVEAGSSRMVQPVCHIFALPWFC
jgi:hypothetical protein